MEGLQLFLLIFQIIIAVILVILVLLQKSDGDSLSGIGTGSGGLNSVVSSKATASILSKSTMILIGIFMLNCLILASLSNVKSKAIEKDLDKIVKEQDAKSNDKKPLQIENSDKNNLVEDSNSKENGVDSSVKESSKDKNKKSNKKIPQLSPIVPAVE
jgi:preprotein translocase subunit SecG